MEEGFQVTVHKYVKKLSIHSCRCVVPDGFESRVTGRFEEEVSVRPGCEDWMNVLTWKKGSWVLFAFLICIILSWLTCS